MKIIKTNNGEIWRIETADVQKCVKLKTKKQK